MNRSDVPDRESSPFRDVTEIDPLVYQEAGASPELRFHAGMFADPPSPVERPVPKRPTPRAEEPWRPGGDVDASRYRPKPRRTHPARVFLGVMIPMVLLIALVMFVMDLYGFLD